MEDNLYICKECWLIGTPRTVSRGSAIIEIFLWGLFLIPGMIYSAWRFVTKEKRCPQCSSLAVIPLNSEIGQRVLGKIYESKRTELKKTQVRSQNNAFFRAENSRHEEVFHLIRDPEQKVRSKNIQ
jgi:hypothetical protein